MSPPTGCTWFSQCLSNLECTHNFFVGPNPVGNSAIPPQTQLLTTLSLSLSGCCMSCIVGVEIAWRESVVGAGRRALESRSKVHQPGRDRSGDQYRTSVCTIYSFPETEYARCRRYVAGSQTRRGCVDQRLRALQSGDGLPLCVCAVYVPYTRGRGQPLAHGTAHDECFRSIHWTRKTQT